VLLTVQMTLKGLFIYLFINNNGLFKTIKIRLIDLLQKS